MKQFIFVLFLVMNGWGAFAQDSLRVNLINQYKQTLENANTDN